MSKNIGVIGSTNILTDQGYIPISKLAEHNKPVHCWNGVESVPVTFTKVQCYDSDNTVTLNTSNGYSVECGNESKVKVYTVSSDAYLYDSMEVIKSISVKEFTDKHKIFTTPLSSHFVIDFGVKSSPSGVIYLVGRFASSGKHDSRSNTLYIPPKQLDAIVSYYEQGLDSIADPLLQKDMIGEFPNMSLRLNDTFKRYDLNLFLSFNKALSYLSGYIDGWNFKLEGDIERYLIEKHQLRFPVSSLNRAKDLQLLLQICGVHSSLEPHQTYYTSVANEEKERDIVQLEDKDSNCHILVSYTDFLYLIDRGLKLFSFKETSFQYFTPRVAYPEFVSVSLDKRNSLEPLYVTNEDTPIFANGVCINIYSKE